MANAILFILFQSGVSIINKLNRQYNCKFCSEDFKWQYELLKHCVFRHFLDDIKKDLPDEFPAKCPKCEFTGRNRSTLVLHYGVTHRVIQKLIEDAQNNPESVANKLSGVSGGKPSLRAAFSAASASQQSQIEKPFSCPLCSLKISRRQQMDHLCTHFSERLSERLPDSGPFACPDCRFVGADRRRLVRHYGGHHGHAHAMLAEQFPSEEIPDLDILIKNAALFINHGTPYIRSTTRLGCWCWCLSSSSTTTLST